MLIIAAIAVSLLAPASRADVRALRLMPVEGITALSQFCDPDNIRQLVGPPNDNVEDIQSAVFGLAVQIDVANPRKGGPGRVLIGLYSYLEESQRMLPEYIATVQRRLGLSASQVERRQIQPCPQFYSSSPTAKTSHAHAGLIHITQGIFQTTAEPIVLATVSIIRTEDMVSDARPPSRTPDRTSPPAASDPRGDATARATPRRDDAPKGSKKSPSVASAPPPAVTPPSAGAAPRRGDGGCDLDCMLEAEKTARAAKGGVGKSDGKDIASLPPPVIAGPPVVARPLPAVPDSGPSASTAPEPVKPPYAAKLKRYPGPSYPLLKEPLSIAPGGSAVPPDMSKLPAAEAGARTVFGVESVECSDEGNWIVGYFGFLTEKPDGTAQFSIRQRYAINNYPNESVATLADLQRNMKLLECTGGNDCRAPRRTIPYSEFLRTRAPPSTSDKSTVIVPKDKGVEWRCRPEKGLCLSRETDHWRCQAGKDPGSSTCIGYDPARWWCVPRREFCYQTVPFGDWGSPHKEGSLVTVRLRPAKDASGQTIEQDHVYDMSHGILSIAQDVLMRRCPAHAGPAREWRASWYNQTAN